MRKRGSRDGLKVISEGENVRICEPFKKQKEDRFIVLKHNKRWERTSAFTLSSSIEIESNRLTIMSVRWSLVGALASKARSSHCAAVTRTGRLLLYSGELRPRIPVDGALHVLDLESDSPWRSFNPSPALTHAPEPRVGATAVYDPNTHSLYVWGGRGGVDMAPLDHFQAGVWKAPLDTLDTSDTIPWERLPSVNDNSDAAPAIRSYHASVLAGVCTTYPICYRSALNRVW